MSEEISTGDILKEELKVAAKNLEKKGLALGEKALLEVVIELDATVKRVADRTPNKIDDLYNVVSNDLVETAKEQIDKLDGEENL